MLISIIVPIYKTEKFLKQCVDSILSQSFEDYELILVDDGSPDDCPLICDKYAVEYEKIIVIHKENGGLVSARKAGSKAARGRYICFIDSDDWIGEDFLSDIADSIHRYNYPDVVAFGYSLYEPHQLREYTQTEENCYYGKNDLREKIYPLMLSNSEFFSFGIFPSVWSKCFSKELVIRQYVQIPDTISLGEDVALTYACLLEAESLVLTGNVSYMYRVNPQSMTHSYNSLLIQNVITLLQYMSQLVYAKKWDCGNQLVDYAVFLTVGVISNEVLFGTGSFSVKRKKLKTYANSGIICDIVLRKHNLAKNYPKEVRFQLFCLKHHLYALLVAVMTAYYKTPYYKKRAEGVGFHER